MQIEKYYDLTRKSKVIVEILKLINSSTIVFFIKHFEQLEEFAKSVVELGGNNINEQVLNELVEDVTKIENIVSKFLEDINLIRNNPNSMIGKLIRDSNLRELFKNKYPIMEPDLLNNKVKRTCIIVNTSKESEQFYIYDLTNYEYYKNFFVLMNSFSNNLRPMKRLPQCGEMFGVKCSGTIYRALKENTIFQSNLISCFLLDYGIEVQVEANDATVFELSDELKLFHPLALCCRLNSVLSYNCNITKENFYEISINSITKFNFQLVKREDHVLDIILEDYHNPFSNYLNEKEQFDLNISVKKFEDKECLEDESDKNKINANENIFQNTINETEISGENKLNGTFKINYKLTDNEKNILYEEPLNTSRALKAVMGYEPKDDKRICKFSHNGECFKGSRCILSHEEKLPHGWTRDTEMVVYDIRSAISIPKVGSVITIEPTAIESATSFFAQIRDEYSVTSLGELTRKWNAHEEILKCLPFNHSMPAIFELVFAKYIDGIFYRARVLQNADESHVILMFLDYGNVELVSISDLRKWEPKFDIIPFQAVLCIFSNVKVKSEKAEILLQYLRKKFLNNLFTAVVTQIHNVDSIYVKVYDKIDNKSLIDEMISDGFFTKCENAYAIDDNQRIPG